MAVLDRTAPYQIFECSWSAASGFSSVRMRGELDRSTSPTLEFELRRAHHDRSLIIVDLRELEFMDSSGARVLLGAHMRAEREDGRVLVIRGGRQIDVVLAATGADETLELVNLRPGDPPEQALAAPPRDQVWSRRSSWCPRGGVPEATGDAA